MAMLVTERRVKYMRIPPATFAAMPGFPEGGKIVGHAFDEDEDTVVLIVEHESFPKVSTPADMGEI